MLLLHLALFHAAACFDIQVEGDLAFDLRVSDGKRGKSWFRQGKDAGEQLVFKMMQVRQNVTAAPVVECIYQYPEKEQVNALLSYMMNELTKIFVRANDFINGVETRRGMRKTRKQGLNLEVPPGLEEVARKQAKGMQFHKGDETRFRVVDQKQKEFFELIYANMTNEYRTFYNTTAERVDRAGRDPCQHQEEVKQIWRDLLEHSLATLTTAARRCVEEFLQEQHVEPRAKVRAKLSQYVSKELAKMRASQLDLLCDTYQLCYNDLLE